jgi:hypothetical protein
MRKGIWILLAVTFMCVAILPAQIMAADAKPELTDKDCAKCHAGPPGDIVAAGARHKSEVSCTDCHESHKPITPANIPDCSECHDGEKHFELTDCLTCHENPHRPLEIKLGDETAACLTCHDPQIEQLRANKSKHTELFCTDCHDEHGKVPNCVDCHDTHSEQMVQADCAKCHQAHQPTLLAYGSGVPNKDCGACHDGALASLSATPTKHQDVACVDCHEKKHQTVPECVMCHESPHPAGIMKKFPTCGACHYVAHDLNNWPEEKKQ